MKYTISANYLDRSSPYRWLVRREDQTPQQAIACKRVVAVNVSFIAASLVESALGCSEVAVTETEPTMEGIKPAEGIDEKAEHDEAVGTTATDAPAEAEADPVNNTDNVPAEAAPAAAETQATNEPAEKLVKLKFAGLFYRMGEDGTAVGDSLDYVQKLVLEEDGSIFGVL